MSNSSSENDEVGYVYILTNPSFREDWVKIGKSSRPVDIRSKELDNTAVPLPFEVYATLRSKKYAQVEKLVHKTIDRLTDLRIRQNREFFNIRPEDALEILKDIASTIDDAVVEESHEHQETLFTSGNETSADSPKRKMAPGRTAAPPFKFSMVGLKPGDMIRFDDGEFYVKIVSDNQIEYEGRLWKLSPFVATYISEERRNISGSYQGPKFFSYNGETLSDMRRRFRETNNNESES